MPQYTIYIFKLKYFWRFNKFFIDIVERKGSHYILSKSSRYKSSCKIQQSEIKIGKITYISPKLNVNGLRLLQLVAKDEQTVNI